MSGTTKVSIQNQPASVELGPSLQSGWYLDEDGDLVFWDRSRARGFWPATPEVGSAPDWRLCETVFWTPAPAFTITYEPDR